MDDLVMMKGRQPRETASQNIDGDRGSQHAVILPGGDQDIVQAVPIRFCDPRLGFPVELRVEELAKIQSIDPLHDHDPGVLQRDKVTNVHQVVLLDFADLLTLVGDALHLLQMAGLRHRLIPGIELDGDLGRVTIDSLSERQVHDPLAAATQLPQDAIAGIPAHLLTGLGNPGRSRLPLQGTVIGQHQGGRVRIKFLPAGLAVCIV